jgi:hypothetical protein
LQDGQRQDFERQRVFGVKESAVITMEGRHDTSATKDGVVTLSGKAKNAAEKDLVTKLVKDVNGVVGVNNLMAIE